MINLPLAASMRTSCRRCPSSTFTPRNLTNLQPALASLSRWPGRSLSTSARASAPQMKDGRAAAGPGEMRMLLVGCPGSGKGTQSSRLLKRYDLNYISAGDVLRQNIAERTEVGKQADQVIQAGGLMPDDIMMRLIGSEVAKLVKTDWLLDGFPRTLGQAKLLDAALEKQGQPLQLVVNLDVPEEVILQRILERWTHVASGRVYNLSFNPPKVPGKDDVTDEPLEQRADDNAETFSKRLTSFHKQTGPMLDYYRTRPSATHSGAPLYVNLAGRTSDEIWPQLDALVSDRFPNLIPRALMQ